MYMYIMLYLYAGVCDIVHVLEWSIAQYTYTAETHTHTHIHTYMYIHTYTHIHTYIHVHVWYALKKTSLTHCVATV